MTAALEPLERATLDDLEGFRKRVVHSASVGIVVVGGVPPRVIRSRLEDTALAELHAGPAVPLARPPEFAARRELRVPSRDSLASICVGGQAAGVSAPDRIADDAAVAAIAGTSFSVLYRKIRSELGLAYDVAGHASHYRAAGVWRAQIVTARSDVETVVAATLEALDSLASEPPDLTDVRRAIAFRVGAQFLLTESALDRMHGFAYHRFVGGLPQWSREVDIADTAALDPAVVSERIARLAEEWSVLAVADPALEGEV
jgi:predicted Zn-dependent peptidase